MGPGSKHSRDGPTHGAGTTETPALWLATREGGRFVDKPLTATLTADIARIWKQTAIPVIFRDDQRLMVRLPFDRPLPRRSDCDGNGRRIDRGQSRG